MRNPLKVGFNPPQPLSREAFRKQFARVMKWHLGIVVPAIVGSVWANHAEYLELQAVLLGVVVVAAAIFQILVVPKLSYAGRLNDIYPALKLKNNILGASLAAIPLTALPFTFFLWFKKGASSKPAPFIFDRGRHFTVPVMLVLVLGPVFWTAYSSNNEATPSFSTSCYWVCGGAAQEFTNIGEQLVRAKKLKKAMQGVGAEDAAKIYEQHIRESDLSGAGGVLALVITVGKINDRKVASKISGEHESQEALRFAENITLILQQKSQFASLAKLGPLLLLSPASFVEASLLTATRFGVDRYMAKNYVGMLEASLAIAVAKDPKASARAQEIRALASATPSYRFIKKY